MNPQSPGRSWQCPPAEAPEKYRLGWLDDASTNGVKWNNGQRGARDFNKGLDILSGLADHDQPRRDYDQTISGHRLKTNIRVATAGLSNIRPLWGYNSPQEFAQYALMLNKTSRALYLEGYWDRNVKEVIQWAAATCTGFMRPVFMRDQAGRGKGRIRLLTYGTPSVVPIQMPSNGDYQEAYAVTLLEEIPIYMAHSKWPLFQDKLLPTSSKYWYSRDIRQATKQNTWKSKAMSWWRPREEGDRDPEYCPLRWTTIIDNAINESGHTIPMGQPETSWYYEVPSYGAEIPDGKGGARKANENDARLYPNRRLIISGENCIPYDGPTFNWHGELDLIPFCLDKWPWEPIGFSMVHDGWELQRAIDEIDRGIQKKIRGELDMPLAYDINSVNPREADDVDPFEPRGRYGYDGDRTEGTPFKTIVPPEVYRVTPETLAVRKLWEESMDYTLQSRDIVELAKARALGKGMDQIEAMISASGPVVKDMCRDMEKSLGQVGGQVGWLILQYETTARLINLIGVDDVTMEVFDYDPSKIIPSHMKGEDPHDPITQEARPSAYTDMERARWWAGNIAFYVTPHSAHEITQMSYRLMLLQGKQRGLPISNGTTMQSMEIPDVKIAKGNFEQDRFYAEKEEEIEHAARMAKIAQVAGVDQGVINMLGGNPSGSGPKGGRPPSGNKPPKQETKAGGRPIISESG